MRCEISRNALCDDEVSLVTNRGTVLATFGEKDFGYPELLEWFRDFILAFDEQYPVIFDSMAQKVRMM